MMTSTGGTEDEVKARIQEANAAFIHLYPVWRAREISIQTKLQIFTSNVKSALLFACETVKSTKEILKDLQTFINRCLRKIFKTFWPNTISHEKLWSLVHETPLEQQIKCRKWKWIGHTLRKRLTAIENEALNWNPQGQRRRGRPWMIWKRTVTFNRPPGSYIWILVKCSY
jgi:hypothetical protein